MKLIFFQKVSFLLLNNLTGSSLDEAPALRRHLDRTVLSRNQQTNEDPLHQALVRRHRLPLQLHRTGKGLIKRGYLKSLHDLRVKVSCEKSFNSLLYRKCQLKFIFSYNFTIFI